MQACAADADASQSYRDAIESLAAVGDTRGRRRLRAKRRLRTAGATGEPSSPVAANRNQRRVPLDKQREVRCDWRRLLAVAAIATTAAFVAAATSSGSSSPLGVLSWGADGGRRQPPPPPPQLSLVVQTDGGWVRGRRLGIGNRTVRQFLGIRYAEPPVGPLRFAKPLAARPWPGVYNATRFGAVCPQPALGGGSLVMGSEDCLFLNVYVPDSGGSSGDGVEDSSGRAAVMVFIHGGAFVAGSASEYDASVLALRGRVVVVTVNYRLGVLGFLRLSGSSVSGSVPAAPGNYGLWDQRLALDWVRRNAVVFGGDSRRVTLFGQSAGAASACLHALSPASRGLFQRVISQSGSASAAWSVARRLQVPSSATGQSADGGVGEDRDDEEATVGATFTPELTQLLGHWGCGGPSGTGGAHNATASAAAVAATLACLRALRLGPLIAAGAARAATGAPLWLPSIDGDFLPLGVDRLLSAGGLDGVDLLLGANSQEGLLFLSLPSALQRHFAPSADPFAGGSSLENGISERHLDDAIGAGLGLWSLLAAADAQLRSRTRRVYGVGSGGIGGSGGGEPASARERLRAAVEILGDIFFVAPAVDLLNRRAKNASRQAYYYVVDHKRNFSLASRAPSWLRHGANHGDELPLVFGLNQLRMEKAQESDASSTVEILFPAGFHHADEAEDRLSTVIMRYWTNFAKTGNPNLPNAENPHWPRYDQPYGDTMLLASSSVTGLRAAPRSDKLQFWIDEVFSNYRQ